MRLSARVVEPPELVAVIGFGAEEEGEAPSDAMRQVCVDGDGVWRGLEREGLLFGPEGGPHGLEREGVLFGPEGGPHGAGRGWPACLTHACKVSCPSLVHSLHSLDPIPHAIPCPWPTLPRARTRTRTLTLTCRSPSRWSATPSAISCCVGAMWWWAAPSRSPTSTCVRAPSPHVRLSVLTFECSCECAGPRATELLTATELRLLRATEPKLLRVLECVSGSLRRDRWHRDQSEPSFP